MVSGSTRLRGFADMRVTELSNQRQNFGRGGPLPTTSPDSDDLESVSQVPHSCDVESLSGCRDCRATHVGEPREQNEQRKRGWCKGKPTQCQRNSHGVFYPKPSILKPQDVPSIRITEAWWVGPELSKLHPQTVTAFRHFRKSERSRHPPEGGT